MNTNRNEWVRMFGSLGMAWAKSFQIRGKGQRRLESKIEGMDLPVPMPFRLRHV